VLSLRAQPIQARARPDPDKDLKWARAWLEISGLKAAQAVLARPVACRAACHIATKMWPAMLTMAMALLVFGGNKVKKCILPSLGDKRCIRKTQMFLNPLTSLYGLFWLKLVIISNFKQK
jgi:hypothetical protein